MKTYNIAYTYVWFMLGVLCGTIVAYYIAVRPRDQALAYISVKSDQAIRQLDSLIADQTMWRRQMFTLDTGDTMTFVKSKARTHVDTTQR